MVSSADFLTPGPTTMILVISCIGPNLYYLRRSLPLQLPWEIENSDDLGDILTDVWNARVRII